MRETGGATPDLDKLVKLSQLFGISLDELVKGEAPPAEPAQKAEPEPRVIYVERAEPAYPWRKIAGLALFGLALLVVLLCTLLGSILAGLLFSLPFWACGVICFVFQKRVGLWCSWAVFFLVDVFLHFATGYASGSFLAVLRGILQEYLNNRVTLWVSLGLLLLMVLSAFRRIYPSERRNSSTLSASRLGSNVSVGFSVVSLTMGNPGLPFGH